MKESISVKPPTKLVHTPSEFIQGAGPQKCLHCGYVFQVGPLANYEPIAVNLLQKAIEYSLPSELEIDFFDCRKHLG